MFCDPNCRRSQGAVTVYSVVWRFVWTLRFFCPSPFSIFEKMSAVGSAIKLSLPGPLRVIGKKHVEIASQWIGSAAAFGATAGIGVCYATDWKLVLQYLPYYNGKFKEEE